MKIFCLILCLGLPLLSFAQDHYRIHGKVISALDKAPLPGASVAIKGTLLGSTTGKDGSFEFTANDSTPVLAISLLGYENRELSLHLPLDSPLLIVLNDATQTLDEVIVSTGYESLPRERATGSFEQIDQDLLNRRVSTDLLTRLDGIVPGMIFDKRIANSQTINTITIRGLSSIHANSAPLVVVDNFPYEGDITNINPNDIESITILKDAAAASIWGARAGNGVIVITTKKGRFNQPLQISFNANLTIGEKPDLFYYPEISSSDFIDVEQFLFEQGYYNNQENSSSRPVLSPVVELLIKKRDGLMSGEDVDKQINALRDRDVRDDFLQHLYRETVDQQYALNMTGGNESYNYSLSAGYDENLLSLKGNQNERITLKADNTLRLSPRLQLNANLLYTLSDSRSQSTFNLVGYEGIIPGSGKSSYYPYASLADEQGSPMALPKDYRFAYIDTVGKGNLLDWRFVPLNELGRGPRQVRSQDIFINAGLRYDFAGKFRAIFKYQYEKAHTNRNDNYSAESYYARNLINLFTNVGETNGVLRPIPLGGIIDLFDSELNVHAFRGQLNTDQIWNDKHQLTALAGWELRQIGSKSHSSRTYGYDDNLLTYSNVDFVSIFPSYDNLSYSRPIPNQTSFGETTNRFISLYGNAAYSYDHRYIVSVSARRDASNLFGVKTNQKWNPLWSAGASWNISRERFYTEALPELKLRITYGRSGNIDNSRSAYATISYYGPDPITNQFFASVDNPPDPNLSWEEVGMFNIGLDISTRDNRIRGSLEYYRKNSENLLASVPIDATTGFSRLTLNSANVKGWGWDVQLASRNLQGKVVWETNLQFSYHKNKVTRYLHEPSRPSLYIGSGLSITPIEGIILDPLFSYKWSGLDKETGDPMGLLKGEVSKDYRAIERESLFSDLVYHGSAVPLYFGSMRNKISWNNFTLSANITYRLAYFFRRKTLWYTDLFAKWSGHADYEKRWTQPGDELRTNVPSMIYPANSRRDEFYANSEVTVERGDHIRLQDISLSYTIEKTRWHALPLERIQVYLYANNLGLLWSASKSGLDPNIRTRYPAPKSIALGVKANF